MKILLDTQALILAGDNALPKIAALAYIKETNELFFSDVSLWEIGIKSSLGKLKFNRKILEYRQVLIEEGLTPLPISAEHIDRAVSLPWHHKDPFDRLLIGQALAEGFDILSGDIRFDEYGCRRIWAS